jgi:hypothetical protein
MAAAATMAKGASAVAVGRKAISVETALAARPQLERKGARQAHRHVMGDSCWLVADRVPTGAYEAYEAMAGRMAEAEARRRQRRVDVDVATADGLRSMRTRADVTRHGVHPIIREKIRAGLLTRIVLEEVPNSPIDKTPCTADCEKCGAAFARSRYYGLPRGRAVWVELVLCDHCHASALPGRGSRTAPTYLAQVVRCATCTMDSIAIRQVETDCGCDIYPGNPDPSIVSVVSEVIQCGCGGRPTHTVSNGVEQWTSLDPPSPTGNPFTRRSFYQFHHPFAGNCRLAPNA